jgi:flagellar protein FliS
MSAFAVRGIHSYRQAEVQSRTPLELVVMLYDGALRFIHDARDAIARGDIRARGEAVSRALAIISELQSTLDMQAGGDIAVSLDELYGFVRGRLLEAGRRQQTRPLDEAISVLTTLREGWSGISRAQMPTAVR